MVVSDNQSVTLCVHQFRINHINSKLLRKSIQSGELMVVTNMILESNQFFLLYFT